MASDDKARVQQLQTDLLFYIPTRLLEDPLFYSALLNLVVHMGNVGGYSRGEILTTLRAGAWKRP